MYKHLLKLLLFSIALLFVIPFKSYAVSDLTERKDVFRFLEAAFHAQVSLSEKGRTLADVNKVLTPYFAENYKINFLKENLVSENGTYRTYGSDFAPYYIPFYDFSEKTKVVILKDEIYVFEYFPENNEGPVTYKAHYEGLLLEKVNGQWRVFENLNGSIPQNVLDKAEQPAVQNQHDPRENQDLPDKQTSPFKIGLSFQPFELLKRYKEEMGEKKDPSIFMNFNRNSFYTAYDANKR